MIKVEAHQRLEAVAQQILELVPPSLLEAREDLSRARTENACAPRRTLRFEELFFGELSSAAERNPGLSGIMPEDATQRSEIIRQIASAASKKLAEVLPLHSQNEIKELRGRADGELTAFLATLPAALGSELLSAYQRKHPEHAVELKMIMLKLLGDAESGRNLLSDP